MQLRLTQEGNRLFDHDRKVVSVSNKRAFTLMDGGYAVPDKGFMARYAASDPEMIEARAKKAADGEKKAKAEAEEAEATKKSRRKRGAKSR